MSSVTFSRGELRKSGSGTQKDIESTSLLPLRLYNSYRRSNDFFPRRPKRSDVKQSTRSNAIGDRCSRCCSICMHQRTLLAQFRRFTNRSSYFLVVARFVFSVRLLTSQGARKRTGTAPNDPTVENVQNRQRHEVFKVFQQGENRQRRPVHATHVAGQHRLPASRRNWKSPTPANQTKSTLRTVRAFVWLYVRPPNRDSCGRSVTTHEARRVR